MTLPVTYLELNTADLGATTAFFEEVFGWQLQPFAELRPRLEAAGGAVVVEPFEFPGVGRGCYCTDPAGLLFGLHEYDAP